MKIKNLTGNKYGRLSVGENHYRILSGSKKKTFWDCRCDCGKNCKVESYKLISGATKSCGCLRVESGRKMGLLRKTTESKYIYEQSFYNVWLKLKRRCNNKNSKDYINYGGRGITYDKRWDVFDNFLEDMLPSYIEGLTLERIDNNGNYEPSNCKWVSKKAQSRNRRLPKNNTSGITGVKLQGRGWVSFWSDINCNKKCKYFSIKKFGEELAFFMASEYREYQIMILNLQGAGYTDSHGK